MASRVQWLTGVLLVSTLLAQPAHAAEKLPNELKGVSVKERLGSLLNLSPVFRDHRGKRVALRDFFGDGKPVILTLNYFRCPTLCTLQLNAVTRGLKALGRKPGEGFRVLTISINPREGPALARKKRDRYLAELGLGEVDWQFLVGKKTEIDKVARSVGFSYQYLPDKEQYAHPTVIFVVSPEGKVSRYIYGLDYPSRQIRFALLDASKGKVGSTVDRILLSCFHFDDTTGRYTPFAFGIMRLGGAMTALVVAILLGLFWRRERRRNRTGGDRDTV